MPGLCCQGSSSGFLAPSVLNQDEISRNLLHRCASVQQWLLSEHRHACNVVSILEVLLLSIQTRRQLPK